MKHIPFFIILAATLACAQNSGEPVNSFFEKGEIRELEPQNIMVQGEVRNPGIVDLNGLPLRSAPIKDVAFNEGKAVFKGAYYVTGYALYDILNDAVVRKSPENDFRPLVDMYVIVENDQGDKAVFSWGELFYRDSFNILVSKTVQSIDPSKSDTEWPLPNDPHLICGTDLYNTRNIPNPKKITVHSFRGNFAVEDPGDTYAPQIELVTANGATQIGDIGPTIEKENYTTVFYGHGMGFKEILDFSGFVLKDVIAENASPDPGRFAEYFAVVSAKDGYRSVFSMNEIMNRNDNREFVLVDHQDSPRNGRYTLMAPGDFFADRDVRSVEKIELVEID